MTGDIYFDDLGFERGGYGRMRAYGSFALPTRYFMAEGCEQRL